MEIIKFSELIGQEIVEVRFRYTPETSEEYSVQSCYTYIKLANDMIIDIPNFGDEDYLHLTPENRDYFQKNFNNGTAISETSRQFLAGQKIVDFFFSYYDNEPEFDYSAWIKLSNNYYLTEKTHAPMGIYVGFQILSEHEFLKEKERLKKMQVEIHSFLEGKDGR